MYFNPPKNPRVFCIDRWEKLRFTTFAKVIKLVNVSIRFGIQTDNIYWTPLGSWPLITSYLSPAQSTESDIRLLIFQRWSFTFDVIEVFSISLSYSTRFLNTYQIFGYELHFPHINAFPSSNRLTWEKLKPNDIFNLLIH